MRYSMNPDGSLDDSISPWGVIRNKMGNVGFEMPKQMSIGDAADIGASTLAGPSFSGKTYNTAPSLEQLDPMGEEAGDQTGGSESQPSMQQQGSPFQGEIPSMENAFGLVAPKRPEHNFGKSFVQGLLSVALPSFLGKGAGSGLSNLMDSSDKQEDEYTKSSKNYDMMRGQMLRNPIFGAAYSRAVQRMKSGSVPPGADANQIIQEELSNAYDRDVKSKLYGRSALGQLRQEGMPIGEAMDAVSAWKKNGAPSNDKATILRIQTKFEQDPDSLSPQEAAQLKAFYKLKRGNSPTWSAEDDDFSIDSSKFGK